MSLNLILTIFFKMSSVDNVAPTSHNKIKTWTHPPPPPPEIKGKFNKGRLPPLKADFHSAENIARSTFSAHFLLNCSNQIQISEHISKESERKVDRATFSAEWKSAFTVDFNSLFTEMFRTSEVRCEVQTFIMKPRNQFVMLAFELKSTVIHL